MLPEIRNAIMYALDSVKAMNEAIANAKPGDATTTQKGVVQLSGSIGTSTTKVPHEKAIGDALGKKADTSKPGTAAGGNTGTSPGNVMEAGAFGLGGNALSGTYPTNITNIHYTSHNAGASQPTSDSGWCHLGIAASAYCSGLNIY